MVEVIVIGAGGHAKVVIEILRENPEYRLVGCVVRDFKEGAVCGLPVIGGDESLSMWHSKGIHHAFVAIGDNALRARLSDVVKSLEFMMVNAVSSHAVVSQSATLGAGVAIMPGAVINAETRIGDGVIINTGATVDHDCELGAYCHVGPGSHLAGHVSLSEGSFIGIGASIIPAISIGAWATVGAGGAVIRDLPAHSFAAGVPARIK